MLFVFLHIVSVVNICTNNDIDSMFLIATTVIVVDKGLSAYNKGYINSSANDQFVFSSVRNNGDFELTGYCGMQKTGED
jgi:hypothetical protein